MLCLAASSPYFIQNLLRNSRKFRKYQKRKLSDTFYRLKKQELIKITKTNHQIYISLTDEGRKKAGWLQIDSLKINKPKKWDKKWRIAMFDISQLKKTHREALRGKLKELGFCPFQKSVWIYPFDCQAEVELLREFFGLSEKELRLVVAEKLGDDTGLRTIFKL